VPDIHPNARIAMQQSAADIAAVRVHEAPPPAGDAPVARRFHARAEAAATVAAEAAREVDRDARFPDEAFDVIRRERLLGIMLPRALGGQDAGLGEIVDICYRLGQACASAAMIYAMHQACLACVLRHGLESPWHCDFLRRVAAEQLLLASSTTEGQTGGNVRASAAPVETTPSGIRLDRAATVVSYGAQADAIVTTARRNAVAAPSDQVLIAFLKEDCTLEPTIGWDALGMRGTCSAGFRLLATGRAEQVLPVGYEQIHPQSMVPVSHLVWSAVWTGIAAAAVERARGFVRRAARQANGTMPPGAAHFAQANAGLQTLRGLIAASVRAFEANAEDTRLLMSIDFQTRMTLTKVQASELAVTIVLEAGRCCGLSGYRNDSEFSVGRHLRDVLSAPIMINNDRILANMATASLLASVPAAVCE
jgi:acyl-CoA dehydrogenase